jgi:hypothetical protein
VERLFFVFSHQSAVTNNVAGEYCCNLSLHRRTLGLNAKLTISLIPSDVFVVYAASVSGDWGGRPYRPTVIVNAGPLGTIMFRAKHARHSLLSL